MIQADIDFWVWLVFILIAGLSKLFGKSESSSESRPPVHPRPRPRPQSPAQQRSMGQPSQPQHRQPEKRPQHVPPYQQRPQQQSPPVRQKPEWQATQDQVRNFLEEIQRRAVSQQHRPPVVQAPPKPRQVQQTPAPPARRITQKRVQQPSPVPPPQIKQKETRTYKKPPPIKPALAPITAMKEEPSRAAKWAEAFRDKQNIRNVIVATEILGPPKAFQN